MLAYHATPPFSDGHGKRGAGLEDEHQHQHRRLDDEPFDPASSRSREPLRRCNHNGVKANQDRDESPSRIAFRNLEESWKRFELESTASAPSTCATTGLSVSGASSSSSLLTRPPYRELIECASLRETTAKDGGDKETELQDEADAAVVASGTTPVTKDSHSNKASDSNLDLHSQGDTNSKPESPSSLLTATKLLPEATSTESMQAGVSATGSESASDFLQPPPPQSSHLGHTTSFLATEEARHILDLPSLLGKDPNMIPDALAIPIPLHASHRSNKEQTASELAAATEGEPDAQENNNDSPTAKLISELDTKAEAAARAMTERYSARNLNMSETDAHRMVQLMAAEIVALHEQREVMLQQMEQAKQDMMEAAQLLRLKAEESHTGTNGNQEGLIRDTAQFEGNEHRLSEDKTQHHDCHGEAKEQDQEEERRSLNASLYDKDEWRR